VLMLGVGEDGHVASIFPEHPSVYVTDGTTMAVRNSPKPPPTRISLTLPTITTAEEVWLMAVGPDKAAAVGMALEGAGPVQVPAAGAVGVGRTLWLLDQASAAHVKREARSLR
jgi:6-phosphogluconolactonase